jgi:hypothetical protein
MIREEHSEVLAADIDLLDLISDIEELMAKKWYACFIDYISGK